MTNDNPESPGAARAIFLTGFMGSGKTTVGRAVARRLGWDFVDLDDEIEREAGKSIAEIFDDLGEAGFRDHEHEALRNVADRCRTDAGTVVALGGGTYAFRRNRDLLRSAGPTIWLAADGTELWKRVRGGSHRPLARDRETFLRLHGARADSYALADIRVDGSGAQREVAARVLGLRWVQDLMADA